VGWSLGGGQSRVGNPKCKKFTLWVWVYNGRFGLGFVSRCLRFALVTSKSEPHKSANPDFLGCGTALISHVTVSDSTGSTDLPEIISVRSHPSLKNAMQNARSWLSGFGVSSWCCMVESVHEMVLLPGIQNTTSTRECY
jgi:hypothetical protein